MIAPEATSVFALTMSWIVSLPLQVTTDGGTDRVGTVVVVVVVGVGIERGCVYCGVAEAIAREEVPPRL